MPASSLGDNAEHKCEWGYRLYSTQLAVSECMRIMLIRTTEAGPVTASTVSTTTTETGPVTASTVSTTTTETGTVTADNINYSNKN